MLGALGAPSGYFSPLLGQVFPGTTVSPSPAAPLCWAFCLPPREQVGPAGLYVQGLGGSCSEAVLQLWSTAGSQAVDLVVWMIPGFGPVRLGQLGH